MGLLGSTYTPPRQGSNTGPSGYKVNAYKSQYLKIHLMLTSDWSFSGR
ncbi:unnamed protein product [Trichobilharzia regenti]|nr:unnamed protein product [Trichobilharzia regenti]